MRLRIKFQVLHPGQFLPLSYQYELSSWCYKLIHSGDSQFAEFLHSKGYFLNKKNFKLFTFSRLNISNFTIMDDRMKIHSHEISFVISFFVDQAAEKMLIGLFTEQSLRLGDKITQVDLKVKNVDVQQFMVSSERVVLKTTSPIVVGKPMVRENGKLSNKYLHPKDTDFEKYFLQNLTNKYLTARKHNLIKEINLDTPMAFRLLSDEPKLQGVTIKSHTKDETHVKGYAFEFELTAPKELIELGMLAGFGGKNSQGFGGTRLVK